jgi:hypothetical protein
MHVGDHHIPVDCTCPDLIPRRLLRVTELVLDQYAIRVEYTITPALPTIEIGDEPPITWLWHAVDNVGNVYTDAGGAYGPSEDGLSTNGVLSLVPLPQPEATSLTITLNPWFTSVTDTTTCTFTVGLSLSPPIK